MAKTKTKEKKHEKPVWLKYSAEEVKAIILKLANKDMTAEKIGLTLRDQYGIPKTKLNGFKIKQVLKEKEKYDDPNIKNLKANLTIIEAHNKKHKHDQNAKRSMNITKAKLKKREEYLAKKAI
jgi:small subunit ribosomal protein S15